MTSSRRPLEQSVADYYAELGITEEVRKTAPAVVETITVNEEKELLRLPEYWQQNLFGANQCSGQLHHHQFA